MATRLDHALSCLVRSSCRESGECELPPDLAAVEPAVALLRDFVRRHGGSAEVISAVELAAVEGLNNAVKHGAAGRPTARLTLRWQLSDRVLTIEITDPSRFDPGPAWFEPPADPLAESGRGGFLIRSLTDEVAHENTATGHTLRMRKRLGPLPPEAPTIADLERELAAMTQDLSDSYESLAALFSFSELLATTPEFSIFLTEVLARLRTLISAEKAYVRFVEPDGTWHLGGKSTARNTTQPEWDKPSDLERRACAERRDVTVEHTDDLPAGDPLRAMAAGGFIYPLTFADRALGVLVVGRSAGNYFTAGQLELVRTAGAYLAIACTAAELQQQKEAQVRVAREFQIAASVQQALLPRQMPEVAGWKIAGLCQSANEVGGDYFDVIDHPGRGFLIVIADVMGKGLPAALLATIFRTSVRARPELCADPGLLLTVINRQLHSDLRNLDTFITAQIAWFDTTATLVRVANAGQGDALRLNSALRGGEPQILKCHGGMPTGILPDNSYSSVDYPVSPGDVLVFLTDGLYEIQGADGRLLGMDGLAALARGLWTGEPKSFASGLLEHLVHYGRPDQPADDRTIVVIARGSPP